MNLKKIAATISMALMLPTTAFAHGELWYDSTAHVPQYKKIVVFPVAGKTGNRYIDEAGSDKGIYDSAESAGASDEIKKLREKTVTYQVNDYLAKRFVRKMKIKTVIPLGSPLEEVKEIRKDMEKYKPLLGSFSSETERAKKVAEIAVADGYILPVINLANTEPHTSPATTVTVQMYTYMKEVDGPNGTREYDRKTWNERHTIPAKDLILYHFGMEYQMYDRDAKKVMTYRNLEHTYGENYGGVMGFINGLFGGKPTKSLSPDRYRLELFKSIVDEFKDDYKDVQKNFEGKDKDKKSPAITIGFGSINLPRNVGGDEYSLKSAYFAMKNLAKLYTNAEIIYNNEKPSRYTVRGTITRYSLDKKWIPPTASTYDSEVSSEDFEWTDRDGNKHTGQRKKYESKITDNFGHYDYVATVSGTFQLVDSNGSVIVSHSATETDDKTADAYRHLLKGFYDKVNAQFGGKK